MSLVKKFLDNNTPFAVMQYFESIKATKKQTFKKYELIYINIRKEVAFKILNEEDIAIVKENINKIKVIVNNNDGRIYEFNQFKEFKEANTIHH